MQAQIGLNFFAEITSAITTFPLAYGFAFVLGVCSGSFGLSLVLRIPAEVSLLKPSYCPHCKTGLRPWELVPLLSYVWQKGRCSQCRLKIAVKYPLFELGFGLLAILVLFRADNFTAFIVWFLMWFLLLSNASIDIYQQWLSAKLLLLSLSLAGLEVVIFRPSEIYSAVSAMLVVTGIFYMVRFVLSSLRNREMLGEGDVTLVGISGLMLGLEAVLVAAFIASVGGILVILILSWGNKKRLSMPLAFGFLLVIASFAVWFFPISAVILKLVGLDYF